MAKHFTRKFCSVLLGMSMIVGCSSIKLQPEQNYWPTNGWESTTPEAQGMSSETLAEMFEKINDLNYDFHHIVIIRNGYKVAECNYYPYRSEDSHTINSITKNITATLIGQAIEEGLVKSVEDPIFDYFPNQTFKNMTVDKTNIRVKDLLTMTSGLQWEENGDYASPTNSNTMMWKSDNQLAYVLDQPVEKSLKGIHNYSTGSTHILSGILSQATGKTAAAYAKDKLWSPLGITSAYWATDNQGVSTGGSRSFYTADDLAKIGLLYLHNGKWAQTQLIPKTWVESSTAKYVETPKGPAGFHGYGYQWWMNPFGGYSGRGYNGQYLFVLPKENVVAVFYGAMDGNNFYKPEQFMASFVLKSILSDKPLKENTAGNKRLLDALTIAEAVPQSVKPSMLPEIISKINKKTFELENGERIALSFDLKNNEAEVNWFTDGEMQKIKVGLDGCYRFSTCNDLYLEGMTSRVAALGGWDTDKKFDAEIRIIEADTVYNLSITFDAAKAKVEFLPK